MGCTKLWSRCTKISALDICYIFGVSTDASYIILLVLDGLKEFMKSKLNLAADALVTGDGDIGCSGRAP